MPSLQFINAAVRLVGACQSDAVVNSLYYRYAGVAVEPSLAAINLSSMFISPTWQDKFLAPLPSQYSLVRVEIQMWDENWNVQFISPLPTIIGETGQRSGVQLGGSGPCATFFFSVLATTQIVPTGHTPVKRTNVAYGPLADDQISSDGRVNTALMDTATVNDLKDALIGVPTMEDGEWNSVRWGSEVANDGKHTVAYIYDGGLREYATFRRSRMNRR